MLEQLIREYRHFKIRRTIYSTRNENAVDRLVADHPPIPKFEWTDGGVRYVAGMSVLLSDERLIFEFTFARNGKPCTFQAILNSYRRLCAKEALTNIRSVC